MLYEHLQNAKEKAEYLTTKRCMEYLDIRSPMSFEMRSRHNLSLSVWCVNVKENKVLLEEQKSSGLLTLPNLDIHAESDASLKDEIFCVLQHYGQWNPQEIDHVDSYYLSLDDKDHDHEIDNGDTLLFNIRFLAVRDNPNLAGSWCDIADPENRRFAENDDIS
jgi:hypothetical protein